MENDFYPILQTGKAPPTFIQNHLTWTLLPITEEGIPYHVTRNDGTQVTDADFATIAENMKFLIAPQYGPVQ